ARSVHAHEDGFEAALSAIDRKIEFFLPATLPGCGDRYANLQFVGAVINNAVNLPALCPVAVSFDRTSFRRRGCAADCVRDHWFKKGPRFLSRSVVDIEERFPMRRDFQIELEYPAALQKIDTVAPSRGRCERRDSCTSRQRERPPAHPRRAISPSARLQPAISSAPCQFERCLSRHAPKA